MASSSQKPVMVTAVASSPAVSMVMARNSLRVTARSGSKKYWFPIFAPVKTPFSASAWAAAAAALFSISAYRTPLLVLDTVMVTVAGAETLPWLSVAT